MNVRHMTDAQLVDALLDKPSVLRSLVENELYRRLWDAFEKGISSNLRLSLSPEDLEDIGSKAMEKAFRNLRKWKRKGKGKLFSWAFKIGRRAAIDWLAKKKREGAVLVGIDASIIGATAQDGTPPPRELSAAQAKIAQMSKFIAEAPPKYQKPLADYLNGNATSLSDAAKRCAVCPSSLFNWLEDNSARLNRFKALLSADQKTQASINWLRGKAEDQGKGIYGIAQRR